jgi:hypothetical protein
MFGEE